MSRPLIGILRGITPAESDDVCAALISGGITRIEVPLNSPDPFDSISTMIENYSDNAEIGAGTVLTAKEVERLAALGAQMVVSPNCNVDVIRATKAAGMKSYPGVMSPTECFTAIEAGADGLKFFPSFLIGPDGLAAIMSVLPKFTETYAVGGVGPNNFAEWLKAGVTGFGVGSSLYRPGDSAQDVLQTALSMVEAYDKCVSQNGHVTHLGI